MVRLLTEAIKTAPIDFVITEGVRTAKRQQELFKQGKSKCDGIKKKSNHQIKTDGFGWAVDLYPLPINFNNKQAFKTLAEHIKQVAKRLNIKVIWGGDWKSFVDMPHWELAK